MSDYVYPWRLIPNKLNHYPGGREIDRFRGVEPAADDDRPEAWVGSTTSYRRPAFPMEGHSECFRPSGGRCYLTEAIQENPAAMIGPVDTLAVLAKLLDARSQLGFQCHPSRENARRLFHSEFGKAEAWVVIGLRQDVAEPPYVLLGFKEGIAREKLDAAFRTRDFPAMDALLHKIPVSVGDVFYVGPGVPHAIGAGCFVVEVQEPSDITVGAWWPEGVSESEKQFHIDRSLSCFDYAGHSYDENLARVKCQPRVLRAGSWGVEELLLGDAQTPYFSCTRLRATQPVGWRKTGRAVVAIVLEGGGALAHGSSSTSLQKGDEIFIPAQAVGMTIEPGPDGLTLMLCHPEGAVHECGPA